MPPETIILVLIPIILYLGWYRYRYLFERHFIVTEINDRGFKIRNTFFKGSLELFVNWEDVISGYKIEGHDSVGWWHQGYEKKLGIGTYYRLVLDTNKGKLIFHPTPVGSLVASVMVSKRFDLSSELEKGLMDRGIEVMKEDISLADALFKNKDWYKK